MDSDDQRDEAIAEAITDQRGAGVSSTVLAKRYKMTSREIEAAVDRRFDYALDNDMRLRQDKLNVARLEALMAPFFERAVKDKDVAAGTLCCKLAERLSLLLGLDQPSQSRIDVYQVTAAAQLKSFERIKQAVYRVARGPDWHPNDGNGSPPDGAPALEEPAADQVQSDGNGHASE